jgi:hypothetical protein
MDIEAPHFEPMLDYQVLLEKDTHLSITLEPLTYTQDFRIVNLWNGEPVQGATITVGPQAVNSDYDGMASLNLVPGDHLAAIRKERFKATAVSFTVTGDTSRLFHLKQILADATIRVRYQGSHLGEVHIAFAGDTLVSSQVGLAFARDVKVDSVHTLTAWKQHYKTYTAPLVLHVDTVVTIHMQLTTGDPVSLVHPVLIYPNPATEQLHLEQLKPPEYISVRDLGGRKVFDREVTGSSLTLDVMDLPPGAYFIHFRQSGTFRKFLVL